MATPAERADSKQRHKHGRRHHTDPAKVADDRRARSMRSGISAYGSAGVPTYGMNSYMGVLGTVTSTASNPPIAGPAPGPMDIPQSGHLNPDQFVGYSGGYSTDAGNLTGVAAIEGAAGNGGAGGSGADASGGDSGGAPS